MRLALVGPVQVQALLPWLEFGDQDPKDLPQGLGGTPVTQLARGLLSHGYELVVVSVDPSVSTEARLAGPQLELYLGRHRPHGRARDFYKAERDYMAGALRRAGPDVVHAHWTYQYALAALASGVPTLITVRDWAPTILRHRPTPFRVVRSLMNVATLVKGQHFTVTSPYMQIRMERWLRRDIPLIPNAIGDDLFLTECLPRPNDIPVILAINNGFSRRKNVPVLLRAFQRVRSIHPPARLRLAGEGYEIHGVAHQWARKKRLEDGVEFLGSRAHHEVVQLLDEATIFAHPAIEESFGLVLVEAMARGVPVIGGESSGAVPWVLGGGHAGVLVDIASEEELTEALLGLLEDKERRDTLAHAALEHARANFRIGAVLGRYSQLYEAIQQEVDSSSWT